MPAMRCIRPGCCAWTRSPRWRSRPYGLVYYGGAARTGAHDRWLRTEAAPQLASPATRMAFDADYEHVLTMQARRRRLDAALEEMAAAGEFTPLVRRMCCLRGVGTLTGFGLAVEIGDRTRFTGNTIGSFVGLVPSEFSSGSSRAQGSITKTGNTHARRLLVEAAWHHRPRYRVGAVMRSRWEQAPASARVRGDEGVTRATVAGTAGGWGFSNAGNGRWWRTWRSPVSWRGGAGRWR